MAVGVLFVLRSTSVTRGYSCDFFQETVLAVREPVVHQPSLSCDSFFPPYRFLCQVDNVKSVRSRFSLLYPLKK